MFAHVSVLWHKGRKCTLEVADVSSVHPLCAPTHARPPCSRSCTSPYPPDALLSYAWPPDTLLRTTFLLSYVRPLCTSPTSPPLSSSSYCCTVSGTGLPYAPAQSSTALAYPCLPVLLVLYCASIWRYAGATAHCRCGWGCGDWGIEKEGHVCTEQIRVCNGACSTEGGVCALSGDACAAESAVLKGMRVQRKARY